MNGKQECLTITLQISIELDENGITYGDFPFHKIGKNKRGNSLQECYSF